MREKTFLYLIFIKSKDEQKILNDIALADDFSRVSFTLVTGCSNCHRARGLPRMCCKELEKFPISIHNDWLFQVADDLQPCVTNLNS